MPPLLEGYRTKIEQALAHSIERLGPSSTLREACMYACLNGGKRLRPILVLLIAEALPQQRDVMPAALSVEYFHTASLIADDLPCMDNDELRRNQPSLHKAFEESIAILASYTFIAAGYGGLYEASQRVQEGDAILAVCLEIVARCAGLRGATQGQYLDLFPPDTTYETIRLIAQCKTVTLFEISFVLGWLFGGGSKAQLEKVKQCAAHFGIAFQIADDLQDLQQDNDLSRINFARVLGIEGARALFTKEFVALENSLQALGLWSLPFRQICQALSASVYTEV